MWEGTDGTLCLGHDKSVSVMAIISRLFALGAITGEQWNGPADAPVCTDLLGKWENDFAAGERAFIMQSQSYTCQESSCMPGATMGDFEAKFASNCMVKASGGRQSTAIQDPVPQATGMGMNVEFHAQKPCKALGLLGLGEDKARPAPTESGSGESGSGAGCSDPMTSCAYPEAPAGLTRMPFLPDKSLNAWNGLAFTVNVGEQEVTDWPGSLNFKHDQIYGVESSVCRICDSDPCVYSIENWQQEKAFYDGGMMMERSVARSAADGGTFTTRAFMFKKDSDKAAAQADSRNQGLKYAQTFGENGCNIEVVWEIEPMAGGGLNVQLGMDYGAATCETEEGLRNADAVYFTGSEVVVLLEEAAIKRANHLDDSCASGYKEMLRFASNFVCKDTEAVISADIIYYNDVGQAFAPVPSALSADALAKAGLTTGSGELGQVQPLSQDPSNPTPFFTGTGVDYFSGGKVCASGASDGERPSGSQFKITASPTTAPDTCSAYYWDPLLSATEGDGMAWEVDCASGDCSSGGDSLAPIIGGSVGGAALILIVLFILYRAKKKGKTSNPKTASV
jgi:hypothetical protein